MIVGIDEVGRGCWAGPLVVGAVILGGREIPGLTDSKKLTAAQREAFAFEIRREATAIGIGWVSPRLIDAYGLSWALKAASRAAVAQIEAPIKEIIIDGIVNFLDDSRVTTMKKADLLVPSVSAASIIAKVARDRYMYKMAKVFTDHGFHTHVGYGTLGHRKALEKFGPTPIHRMSYVPLGGHETAVKTGTRKATTGYQAELLAAQFLENEGFRIVARNWRTRWCEIDIIVERQGVLHFVEVKYRRTPLGGDGLAAITTTKLRQMKKAAEMWLHHHRSEANAQLSVITLEDQPMRIVHWLPNVT